MSTIGNRILHIFLKIMTPISNFHHVGAHGYIFFNHFHMHYKPRYMKFRIGGSHLRFSASGYILLHRRQFRWTGGGYKHRVSRLNCLPITPISQDIWNSGLVAAILDLERLTHFPDVYYRKSDSPHFFDKNDTHLELPSRRSPLIYIFFQSFPHAL